MTIKEIAAAFDMNVTEFASLCDCSRQTLYNGFATKRRTGEILLKLCEFSSKTYDEDMARAYDKQTKRIAAIEAFAANIREVMEA